MTFNEKSFVITSLALFAREVLADEPNAVSIANGVIAYTIVAPILR